MFNSAVAYFLDHPYTEYIDTVAVSCLVDLKVKELSRFAFVAASM